MARPSCLVFGYSHSTTFIVCFAQNAAQHALFEIEKNGRKLHEIFVCHCHYCEALARPIIKKHLKTIKKFMVYVSFDFPAVSQSKYKRDRCFVKHASYSGWCWLVYELRTHNYIISTFQRCKRNVVLENEAVTKDISQKEKTISLYKLLHKRNGCEAFSPPSRKSH